MKKLLGWFFNALYRQFAWGYDWVAWAASRGRWYRWTSVVIPFLSEGPILEVGFGTGHLQDELLSQGKDLIGIDSSWQMCKIAKKRLASRHHSSCLIQAKGEAIPLPAQQFSCVIATFPAPYIFAVQTLAEIYRVLSPSGKLLILFAVQMDGSSLPETLLRFIYRTTGQDLSSASDLSPILDRITAQGFRPVTQWIPSGSDKLLLIEATKPNRVIS
jgi:ubiquinone/menaquinone biosynthesis C-methylase UbiE